MCGRKCEHEDKYDYVWSLAVNGRGEQVAGVVYVTAIGVLMHRQVIFTGKNS
jgi:hypothetical protein